MNLNSTMNMNTRGGRLPEESYNSAAGLGTTS